MLLFVEMMASEWTGVGICLVVTLAVNIFERMRAWFVLFSFKVERVNLEISLATPGEVVVMFNFVRTVAL